MRMRFIGTLSVLSALTLGMLVEVPAWAQASGSEKPLLYTYVSTWAVPRAMWGDYLKLEAAEDQGLSAAVADGTLVAYGRYSVLSHQEGQPTHGSWFSARSMANLMKALEGLRSAPDNTASPLASSKHWDFILESRDHNAHSGTFKNGYLRISTWAFKPGASDPDGKTVRAIVVPALEKLLADGTLHAYQIDLETVHSSDPGVLNIAVVANGPEGLDKYNAALANLRSSNPSGMAGFESLVDPHGHRDVLAHVDTMTHK